MNKFVYALFVGAISATKWTTTDGGPTFEIVYNSVDKKYDFQADVAVGTDLWLLYSTTCDMTSCDMVQFLTSGAGSIKDAYGTLANPRNDFINDYKSTKVVKSGDGKSMTFTGQRDPAPTDVIGKDTKFVCGTETEYTWVLKSAGDTGTWKFKLNDDCTVWEAPAPEPTPEPTDNTGEEKTGATYVHAFASTVATTAMLATLF